MAGLKLLLPYIWRAHWRGIRAQGPWRAVNIIFMVVVGLLILPVFVTGCILAFRAWSQGDEGSARLLTGLLLSWVFGGWIVLPVLIQGMQAKGEGITPAGLLQHPLSMGQLMLVGVASALMQPVYWILGLASAAMMLPLLATPEPLFGVLTGILFIVLGALLSWSIGLFGQALFTSRRPRELAFVALVFFLGLFYFLVVLSEFRFEHGSVFIEVLGRDVLLVNRTASDGVFTSFRRWMPGSWVLRAAIGSWPWLWVGALAVAVVACYRLSSWSLRRTLVEPVAGSGGGGAGKTMGGIPGLKSPVGVATRKEIHYLTRNLDPYTMMLVALAGAGYIVLTPRPDAWVSWMALPGLIFIGMSVPMNAFGLDLGAIDRYRLLPLSGKQILISKNLAFAVVLAVVLLPVLGSLLYRFDGFTVLRNVLLGMVVLLVLLTWGNEFSVRSPRPRQFFAFSGGRRDGNLIVRIAFVLTLSAMVGIGAALQEVARSMMVWTYVGLILALGFVYFWRLGAVGRIFENSAAAMRARLSE